MAFSWVVLPSRSTTITQRTPPRKILSGAGHLEVSHTRRLLSLPPTTLRPRRKIECPETTTQVTRRSSPGHCSRAGERSPRTTTPTTTHPSLPITSPPPRTNSISTKMSSTSSNPPPRSTCLNSTLLWRNDGQSHKKCEECQWARNRIQPRRRTYTQNRRGGKG